jgi:hypothetical protein
MTEESTPQRPKPTRAEIEAAALSIINVTMVKLFIPGAKLAALSRDDVEAVLRDAVVRAYRLGLESKS